MQIQEVLLPNKIKTLFVQSAASNLCSVQIWFRVGSALEREDEKGIAHFIEHMLFKGSSERKGTLITKQIESWGGEINAFTSYDYTCYYINAPAKNILKATDILLDMVINHKINPADLVAEKQVVIEELLRGIDNPNQYLFHQLQKSCFRPPYDASIIGNKTTIQQFTPKQILNFKNRFYTAANSFLIVGGNYTNALKNKLSGRISRFQMPIGTSNTLPAFKLRSGEQISIHRRDVQMAQMILCIPATSFDAPENAAEQLTLNCLSHGETSIFFQKLVYQTALVNSCHISTLFLPEGGAHLIKINLKPANLAKTLDKILEILQEKLEERFDNREIEKIINQYVAAKIYEKESLDSTTFSFGFNFIQRNNISAEEQFIEQVKKCHPYDIYRSILSIFSRPIDFVIQFPKSFTPSAQLNPAITKFKLNLRAVIDKYASQLSPRGHKLATSRYDRRTEVIQLRPGIKLLYRKNEQTPTFSFHTYIRGGLESETDANNGIHNILSAVLPKGNQKENYLEIQQKMDFCAASFSGVCGKNSYGLTLLGQTKDFSQLMSTYLNSLFFPSLTQKEIAFEKKMLLRALKQFKKDPVKQCFRRFHSIVFQNHYYNREITGTPETVQKLTRNQIASLHSENLTSKELIFAFSGNLDPDLVLYQINQYLKYLPPRQFSQTNLKVKIQIPPRHEFIRFDREQSHLILGVPTLPMNTHEHILIKILSTYFSGQSSPLFLIIREKMGLCYNIQPIHYSALNGGYWGIYLSTSPQNTNAGLEQIKLLLANLAQKGISKAKWREIKSMIEGQSLINLQTNEDFVSTYAIPELYFSKFDNIYRMNEAISKVKVEEFNQFLKKFFSKKFSTVVCGRTPASRP